MDVNKINLMKRTIKHFKFSTNHQRISLFWIAAIIGLIAPWAIQVLHSQETTTTRECTVSSVYDGDTMRVKCEGELMKVRLYCIDTPEMGQKPWGRESRDFLRGLAPRGSSVQIKGHKKDRYGRLIGEVFNDGLNLNLDMVRAGQAAVYPKYCKDEQYYMAQNGAKDVEKGIWTKTGSHQTPWKWRK